MKRGDKEGKGREREGKGGSEKGRERERERIRRGGSCGIHFFKGTMVEDFLV